MTQTTDLDNAIEQAADRLLTASRTHVACAPVRDVIGATDLPAAYRAQQRINDVRIAGGARVVGRKIGLTSKAVQDQLGVDQPDFGVLFDDMGFADGDVVPMTRLLQPKAEAEIAFVLGADLVDGPLDAAQVADAIAYGVAALEICDSRIADWDIRFGDTVADNASAGLYVLGTETKTLAEFSPVDTTMSMSINGAEVSTGSGADCLGDPLNAVAWLAQAARDNGAPLLAGQVILSGALGPMRPLAAGDDVRVDITGLGSVTAYFSSTNEETAK
ncbi:2-keto-4-pentenoate hydratase [Gordonia sp. TBRC 11910]|uniref:2-keto-4-pentenoate hydratase n=1 Tax=Gordonia asplenii TaxID=2725283 RepID=A0A848KTH0_9ACTN|nr:fumarylacetoacetate hydrolase family protein [Gordonia asplenii]NMN99802.1 2-keto-4-pentenoate hydratase [Gordonia asplenii]